MPCRSRFALLLVLVAPAAAQKPDVDAPAAVLVESSTGDVVYERNAGDERPIASTTKLMTALLALEGIALDDVLTAPGYEAGPAESVIGLREGERITVTGEDTAGVASPRDAGGSRPARLPAAEK